jgi:hypothetical protein
MTNQEQEHMNRAKAWCFDNGVTEEQIQTAWDNAKENGVLVVQNLSKHGHSWWWLPPHLLQQLFDRYLPQAIGTTASPSVSGGRSKKGRDSHGTETR